MPTIYDEFPYPGAAFAQTHPDHLATLAILFGMTPAPAEHCRVLELGCGDGGNVIPMAYGLISKLLHRNRSLRFGSRARPEDHR